MVKNSNFWPIVKDATGLKLLFSLFLATLRQNSAKYMTKGAKIVNLLWKSSKNTTMGRFLKKCHTEYFLIYHFGKPLGCLRTSTPGFTRPTKFGKLALKKGCDVFWNLKFSESFKISIFFCFFSEFFLEFSLFHYFGIIFRKISEFIMCVCVTFKLTYIKYVLFKILKNMSKYSCFAWRLVDFCIPLRINFVLKNFIQFSVLCKNQISRMKNLVG